MEAVDLLRDQAVADNLMTQVFAKVTPELAAWRLEGSTANPIASTFLHVYLSEDRLVQTAQGKPTIFESGGWEERLGFDRSNLWSPGLRLDPDTCRAYAAEVHAATRSFLDGVQPDVLEREIELPFGRAPLLSGLSLMLVIRLPTWVTFRRSLAVRG